jgi:hypothetical protein
LCGCLTLVCRLAEIHPSAAVELRKEEWRMGRKESRKQWGTWI